MVQQAVDHSLHHRPLQVEVAVAVALVVAGELVVALHQDLVHQVLVLVQLPQLLQVQALLLKGHHILLAHQGHLDPNGVLVHLQA